MTFRKLILVTGSRDWTDVSQIETDLEMAWGKRVDDGSDVEPTVIEGGARGADSIAGAWARRRRAKGVANVQFKADWTKHGKAAGPIRNQEMLDWLLAAEGYDQKVVYAYPLPDSIGTKDMIDRALRAGVAVRYPGQYLAADGGEREEQRMADTTESTEATLRGSVSFKRDINDGNYGTTGFMHTVQYDIDPSASAEKVIESARAAVLLAKTVVFSELGLAAEFNEDGVLLEVPREVPKRAAAAAAPAASSAPSGEYVRPQVRGQEGELPEWFDDQVKAARAKTGRPINAVWDNRSKATGRQPVFKEVVPAEQKNSAAGIWPPKGA